MKPRIRAAARRGCWARLGLYLSVLVLISPAILFFLWMLSLSLKNEADNTAYPPVFIPKPPTLANFIDVFAKNDFLTYTINSVIVSFSATGLALLFGVPAGYGIAKTKAMKAAVLILIARVTPGPVLPDPAVPAVPVARHDRHADAADHHPSGDHRADRGVDHDRLLRGTAGRTGGSGAGRWRDDLAGVPLRRGAAGAAGHHGGDDPVVHLQLEQFHLRRGAGRARPRARCRSRSTTC